MEHRSHSRGRSGTHSSAPPMWVTYFPEPQQGKWPPHRVPPVPSAPTTQTTCAPLPASNPLGSPFSALVPASESLLCPLQGPGAGSLGSGATGAGQHPTTCPSPALPQPALCCHPPEDPGPHGAGSQGRALADLGVSLHGHTRSLFNPVQTRTHRYTDSRARVQHSRIQKTCVTRPYDTLCPWGVQPPRRRLQRGSPHCHFLLLYKTLTPRPCPFQTPSPRGRRSPGIGSEGPGPACPRCQGAIRLQGGRFYRGCGAQRRGKPEASLQRSGLGRPAPPASGRPSPGPPCLPPPRHPPRKCCRPDPSSPRSRETPLAPSPEHPADLPTLLASHGGLPPASLPPRRHLRSPRPLRRAWPPLWATRALGSRPRAASLDRHPQKGDRLLPAVPLLPALLFT